MAHNVPPQCLWCDGPWGDAPNTHLCRGLHARCYQRATKSGRLDEFPKITYKGRTAADKREQDRLWRENNKERKRENDRKYREANAEKIKAYKVEHRDEYIAYSRAKYWADPEKYRERSRAWAKANPERAAAKNKEWRRKAIEKDPVGFKAAISVKRREQYLKDPAKAVEKTRLWREANPERARELNYRCGQAYKAAHPEKAREAAHRRRALLAGAESDGHTLAEKHAYWRSKGMDPSKCHYCGALVKSWELSDGDHVIPVSRGGGHTVENLVPCCWGTIGNCQNSKGSKLLSEWTPPNMMKEKV